MHNNPFTRMRFRSPSCTVQVNTPSPVMLCVINVYGIYVYPFTYRSYLLTVYGVNGTYQLHVNSVLFTVLVQPLCTYTPTTEIYVYNKMITHK